MHRRIKQFKAQSRHPVLNESLKMFAVIIGAVFVALGLELFLVPNDFLDGGITGISIILTRFFNVPLGVFIAVLNIPFVVAAFLHSGIKTAARTAVGIAALAVSTIMLHHVHPATEEFALALGYGGLLVGVGVGLALRYGGALDGTEALAAIISQRTNLSIDRIILLVNFGIFLIAACIISPESAMASFLLFYVVVTPIIKKVMEGGSETRTAQILTAEAEAITEAIHEELNRKVIWVPAQRFSPGVDAKESAMLTVIIARLEEPALTEIVENIDPSALIIFNDAQNIHGGMLSKSKHH